jgi:hypothetical protein
MIKPKKLFRYYYVPGTFVSSIWVTTSHTVLLLMMMMHGGCRGWEWW